jgi:hypothetical protein
MFIKIGWSRTAPNLIRDEEVVGSNPATPTSPEALSGIIGQGLLLCLGAKCIAPACGAKNVLLRTLIRHRARITGRSRSQRICPVVNLRVGVDIKDS